jgi:hypothetical protein
MRTAMVLWSYLGFGFLLVVGVDATMAEWDKAHRPNTDDGGAALAQLLEAYRLCSPIDPEAFPKPEAPDFRLPALDEDRTVRLSDFRGHKPVVLIFGSFGWDVFCSRVVHVRRLHEKYRDRAQFLLVYVSEAGHELPSELRPFAEPPGASEGSRLRLLPRVRAGQKHFDLRFPCLVDNEQNEVETLYRAYPSRLILVSSAGRIVLDSGPLAFDPSLFKRVSDWLDRQETSLSPWLGLLLLFRLNIETRKRSLIDFSFFH